VKQSQRVVLIWWKLWEIWGVIECARTEASELLCGSLAMWR
jgi:hypothetical protein